MSLLARIAAALESKGIPHALIGASALTLHGVNRSTIDQDLLAVDRTCLDRGFWKDLEDRGVEVEIRRGDVADPLAGVARFRSPGERPVDLVVGKFPWQQRILERARPARYLDVPLPVVGPADLVLLKLYAGGPQDAWDIQQLLLGEDRDELRARVEERLPELPERFRGLWEKILLG